jgi:hypothetical protein
MGGTHVDQAVQAFTGVGRTSKVKIEVLAQEVGSKSSTEKEV